MRIITCRSSSNLAHQCMLLLVSSSSPFSSSSYRLFSRLALYKSPWKSLPTTPCFMTRSSANRHQSTNSTTSSPPTAESTNHTPLKNQPIPTTDNSSSNNNTTDLSDIIVLPQRKYGYRTTPLTWSELRSIILEEQNLAKLSRSLQQEQEYQVYLRDLKRKWRSVYDHILVSKFGFEAQQKEQPRGDDASNPWFQRRWQAYPPLTQVKAVQKVLMRNDFPYNTDEDIEHWVLWKLVENITKEEIDEAKDELRERLGNVVDILHWVNPPHLKSLPDIDHAHFLCLRRRRL